MDCIAICSVEQIFVNVWRSWGLPTEWEEALHQQRRKFLGNHGISTTLLSLLQYSTSTWSQTPEQQRAKSWAQCTSQSTQRAEDTHHSPLFIMFKFIAAKLTAHLLMIPPILGNQTAQHRHHKSSGDGIEGESKISGDGSKGWSWSRASWI